MFLSVEEGGKKKQLKNHMQRLLDYTEVSFNRKGTETQTGPNVIRGMFCESRRVKKSTCFWNQWEEAS